MLFPSEEEKRLRRRIVRDLKADRISPAEAVERLGKLGDEALALMAQGNERKMAGDLDGAEEWYWKAVARQPTRFDAYLSLAEVRRKRGAADALAPRLRELALSKLGEAPEIPEEVAEHFRKALAPTELDFSDPETYRSLATVAEVQRQKEEAPPAVRERLLPYLLLDDLQRQAPETVDARVVKQIRENAGICAPLLWAAVRDWARHPHAAHPQAVALFVAMLGEIGGAELTPELLELASSPDNEIFLHANWAIWRMGQRFPQETLAAFRECAPQLPLSTRCAVAEHLALMPKELDIYPVATAVMEEFRSFAKRDDAPYLLLAVLFAFGQREDHRGERFASRYGDMLGRKGQAWLMETLESEDFVPRLIAEEIDEMDIEDVCVERRLMDEEDDDEDEDDDDFADEDLEEDDEDDEEEDDDEEEEDPEEEDFDEDFEDEEDENEEDWQPPMPVHAPIKPGRNDACWCGSGKKYKKCHLASDEEAERSGKPAPSHDGRGSAPETNQQVHRRMGSLVFAAAARWYKTSELAVASDKYFGRAADPSKLDDETADLFFQWYLHDYRPKSTGRTAFEEYVRREGGRLSPRDRAVLESMRDARYGLFEVQRVEEGRGIEVRNVYRGDRFFVNDRTSSKEAVRWDCLLTRVEHFEGRYEWSGNGQAVPRNLLGPLQEFIETESRRAACHRRLVAVEPHLWRQSQYRAHAL